MTKEELLHAAELQTTIRDIEQLVTILENDSIEEVKMYCHAFGWKPSPDQEKRIRAAIIKIIKDQRAELERLKAELAAL